jgi:hypothetical protein
MTNAQVFAAFASRKPAKGGSVRTERIGNTGVVLYSYGTPIAINTSVHGVVFDVRKYSVTTSKQASAAKRAAAGPRDLNHGDFRQLCRDLGVHLGSAR